MSVPLFTVQLEDSSAKAFINTLLNDRQSLIHYIDPNELLTSNRLGTNYTDSDLKLMIGYDFTPDALLAMKNQEKYSYKIKALTADFSLLTISLPKIGYSQDFYFKDDKLISPLTWFTCNMKTIDTKYVRYYFSDSIRYNSVAAEYLNTQIDSLLTRFNQVLTHQRIQLLESKKINYIITANAQEMQTITGFNTTGIAYLNTDTVVSQDPAHFHEVVHLLINFILKDTKTYTQPLFQEGLAVALGGRSGKSPEVLFSLAAYLLKQNFLTFEELTSREVLSQVDASLSYPVSGLIVKYLLNTLDSKEFLNLYRKYTVNESGFSSNTIDLKDLKLSNNWNNYLAQTGEENLQNIKVKGKTTNLITKREYSLDNISLNNTLCVQVNMLPGYLLLKTHKSVQNYQSRIFQENLPKMKYSQERYLIKADSTEVVVYDLYLDQIIMLLNNEFFSENKVIENKGKVGFIITDSNLIKAFTTGSEIKYIKN